MHQVTRQGPDRVDITLTGKLDAHEMKELIHELYRHGEGIRHGRILYTITGFDLPTFGAMAVELAHLPKLMALIHRFERIAVLADKAWIKKISELEGALIPGLDIRAFDPGDRDTAETWLLDSGADAS